jgi:hypothetical protein
VRTQPGIRTDAGVQGPARTPHIRADAVLTAFADGKNMSPGVTASTG